MKKYILGIILFTAFLSNAQSDDLAIDPVQRSQGRSQYICNEFRQLLDTPQPQGIEHYALENAIPIGGSEGDARYFNIDIDSDDVNDLVVVNCSASGAPADPCGLWIELSSGKKIEFNEDRFYLMRHRSKVYVVVNHIGAKKNIGKRKIYRVEKTGVKLVCQKL